MRHCDMFLPPLHSPSTKHEKHTHWGVFLMFGTLTIHTLPLNTNSALWSTLFMFIPCIAEPLNMRNTPPLARSCSLPSPPTPLYPSSTLSLPVSLSPVSPCLPLSCLSFSLVPFCYIS